MKLFENIRWPFLLLFYPAIVLTGFILSSADLSFKSQGLLISDHLEIEVMDKFKREKAHLESFVTILSDNYNGYEINDPSHWFSNIEFDSFGLTLSAEPSTLDCSDLDDRALRKEAFASLWYYPKVFSSHYELLSQDATEWLIGDANESSPNSILFLSSSSQNLSLEIIHCERYLLFIPSLGLP